jgi:hypothetical protein
MLTKENQTTSHSSEFRKGLVQMIAKTTEQTSTRSTFSPQYIYGYEDDEDRLYRVNLLTDKRSSIRVPGYVFRFICQLNELPDGTLVITGGRSGGSILSEVDKIDTLREYAVSYLPPMHTPRYSHAAVLHSQYLYVLGGRNPDTLSECERYVCAESRWEDLPELPVPGFAMSAVVLDSNLYALGGGTARGEDLDTVQRLSLDSLTWELLDLKLPKGVSSFPCFKIETQVFLLINWAIWSFTPLNVKRVKTLDISEMSSCITSICSRGILYYSSVRDGINRIRVGELTQGL